MKKIIYISLFIISFFNLSYSQTIPTCFSSLSDNDADSCHHKLIRYYKNSNRKTLSFYFGESLSQFLFREEHIPVIKERIKEQIHPAYRNYELTLYAKGKNIETLVPNIYRKNLKKDKERVLKRNLSTQPLVANKSRLFEIKNGLENKHIALWHSHGWHYNTQDQNWEWQRPRLFGRVEDLLSADFTLPFLIPMLENAGANVLVPRERCTQPHEIIIDNDSSSPHSLHKTHGENWKTGKEKGFADSMPAYKFGENPFALGSYLEIKKMSEADSIEYIPDIPEKGNYAVYVSYKTIKNSTEKAKYTVYHTQGTSVFEVNQTMGGGTWIYLGTFPFDKGLNPAAHKVVLSFNENKDKIITADAVRFGGGVGNIIPKTDSMYQDITYPSFRPRYMEASRYWLQWAGMPDSVYYSKTEENEYRNDIYARGNWVNYLTGATFSGKKQTNNGLNIPLDLAVAIHTDAGIKQDTIVGSLAICTTKSENKNNYKSGTSRMVSRDFADVVLSQITEDMRSLYTSDWTNRGILDQSYIESRVPEIPTVLLELLSHQNLEDMQYALDPKFRFNMARAIYKGITKFLAYEYNYEYHIQPLPVCNFALSLKNDTIIQLTWNSTDDILEKTATPTGYIVHIKTNNGAFNQQIKVDTTRIEIPIKPNNIYSFKVTAFNNGGESFPSETLSACRKENAKGTVLVVNGFNRVSGPASFETKELGGFTFVEEHGMPYHYDIGFTGNQYEYRKDRAFVSNRNPGFGASHADYETQIIAGNTFDYPYIHGTAIAENGYSFVSCSKTAVEAGIINLSDYNTVDFILGAQRETKTGNYNTFSPNMQQQIKTFCAGGGNIFISGSYIASDLWEREHTKPEDITFATQTLKYNYGSKNACRTGKVKTTPPLTAGNTFEFHTTINSACYAAESVDEIIPVNGYSRTILRYEENNFSAGIAHDGAYKTIILGFPFETIKESDARNKLMNDILNFLDKKDESN